MWAGSVESWGWATAHKGEHRLTFQQGGHEGVGEASALEGALIIGHGARDSRQVVAAPQQRPAAGQGGGKHERKSSKGFAQGSWRLAWHRAQAV